jgi:hypothetical protein
MWQLLATHLETICENSVRTISIWINLKRESMIVVPKGRALTPRRGGKKNDGGFCSVAVEVAQASELLLNT